MSLRPLIGVLCGLSGEKNGGSAADTAPRAYSQAVRSAGGAPVLIPCSDDGERTLAALQVVRGLIITGGCDIDPSHYGQEPRRQFGRVSPERDALDKTVVSYVVERPHLPVLGICRGIQAMNVFAGGTLIQDIPSQLEAAMKHSQSAPGWYGTHDIEIAPASELARTLGPDTVRVNTFHHEAVDVVAEGFRVAARSSDGVVEAIERQDAAYCLGVQFHPELMAPRDERIARLFGRLVSEAQSG